MSDAVCAECKGTGTCYRKYWTQGPPMRGIHPAILAGRVSYRSIHTFQCPSCKERAEKMKGSFVFVVSCLMSDGESEVHVKTDAQEARDALFAMAAKRKVRFFAHDLFCGVDDLVIGKTFTHVAKGVMFDARRVQVR